MSYIDLKSVQAAEVRLLEQIFIFQSLQEELEQIEQKIKNMAYMEETLFFLKKSRRELEEEIHILRSFAECLVQVRNICEKTEKNIAGTYDLEAIVYPETVFGISKITGLAGYEHLLSLQK